MSQNPFAPPTTGYDDPIRVPTRELYRPPTVAALLFSFEGRIRRTAFWFATSATTLVFVSTFVALSWLILQVLLSSESRVVAMLVGLLFVGVLFLYAWILLALIVKRLHDRNWSGFCGAHGDPSGRNNFAVRRGRISAWRPIYERLRARSDDHG